MLVGLPSLYGRWLLVMFGTTQHAGLAEDVLDHRLNTRTVLMGPVLRFLYLNMNYHLEHHMYPAVPYHALPRLHDLLAADLPEPYPNMRAAYRDIIPALRRQHAEPGHHLVPRLPA
jgi:fatty acid desaturase